MSEVGKFLFKLERIERIIKSSECKIEKFSLKMVEYRLYYIVFRRHDGLTFAF